MSGRVRAAGRNLTVGELREALDDLDDGAPVLLEVDLDDVGLSTAEGMPDRLLLNAGEIDPYGQQGECRWCGCDGSCVL